MISNHKQIFLNKICTIFVKTTNRNFNEEQNINYFVGKVIDISQEGILIEHPENKCKSYFYKESIVSIAEEPIVYEKKQNLEKEINPYDDIDNLTEIIKR